MKKYLCRVGFHDSTGPEWPFRQNPFYIVVEASNKEQLQSDLKGSYGNVCTIVREAFDDEWYENEDGGFDYVGDGSLHKDSNNV